MHQRCVNMVRKRIADTVDSLNQTNFENFNIRYLPSELLTYTSKDKATHDTAVYDVQPKTTPSNNGTAHDSPHQHMSELELDACLDLISRTSKDDYKASVQGWNVTHKRDEMREMDMRYLLVRRRGDYRPSQPPACTGPEPAGTSHQPRMATRDSTGILGFMSLMLTIEEGQPVVYIYEIHLEPQLRGLGLGKHLFTIAEHIGRATGMEKVMLTCFRSNARARAFYTAMGYDIDECSPRPRRLRGGVVKEVDYIILSQRLKGQRNHLEPTRSKKLRLLEGGD